MALCNKCWNDAYTRSLSDTTKTQTEHYTELIKERENNPCKELIDEEIEEMKEQARKLLKL